MTTQKQAFWNVLTVLLIKMEISHLHKYSDPLLSTFLKPLWQRLQPCVFLGMTLQACIWGVSPIILCRSSQNLSGWMGSVAAQIFSSLSRDVRSSSSPGSCLATQGHWDISQSHSCVALAMCLGALSCWKVNLHPSLRSWALWWRFSSRISLYIDPFIFLSILTSVTVSQSATTMLPPPCFTVGMVPGFLQT